MLILDNVSSWEQGLIKLCMEEKLYCIDHSGSKVSSFLSDVQYPAAFKLGVVVANLKTPDFYLLL